MADQKPTTDPGDVPADEPTPEPVASTGPETPTSATIAPLPPPLSRVDQVTADQAASQDLNARLEAAVTEAQRWAGTANTAAYEAAVAEVARLEKLRG